MPRIRLACTLLLALLVPTVPTWGQASTPAAKGKTAAPTAPAVPDLIGVIVALNKNETNNVGSISVQPDGSKAKPVTIAVNEATQFQYFNQVSAWGTNFLAEHRGEKVAVFNVAAKKPATAATVQILLPAPKPRNPGPPPARAPKPSWAHGTVVDIKNGAVTIKLPNYTPPPPVRGVVTDVGVDKDGTLGVITVRAAGKLQTFVVDPTTAFQKMKGKDRVRVSFLSIDQGETVEVFGRYGAPHAASKVDVVLKGAGEAAIVYKDHFLTFQMKPATKFEMDRAGKLAPVALSAVHKGESVAILPDGLQSHVAAEVKVIIAVAGPAAAKKDGKLEPKKNTNTAPKNDAKKDAKQPAPKSINDAKKTHAKTSAAFVNVEAHSKLNASALAAFPAAEDTPFAKQGQALWRPGWLLTGESVVVAQGQVGLYIVQKNPGPTPP